MSQTAMTVDQERTIRSSVVLANAGEVAVRIVSQISGNEISTAVNGTKLTNEMIQSLLYRRIADRVQLKAQVG
jgi:ribosomal protein S3AE